MQRYFIDSNLVDKDLKKAIIKDLDFHHIKNVMRMKINDEIIVCFDNLQYRAKIASFLKDYVEITLIEEIKQKNELFRNITIAHGLTTREKREEVIDKITALGCYTYIPVLLKKCVVKLNDHYQKQTERFNRIAKEAAEQSQRSKILEVQDPIPFKELLKKTNDYDICLFASTKQDPKDLTFWNVLNNPKYQNILILIGPEAGIDDLEEETLIKANWHPITLGKRILRTELAPVMIMSIISFFDDQEVK